METQQTLSLRYTLMCDDVRIEMGNKISLMGIFQNIMVDKLPVSLIKFAVINHWEGQGNHETEIRVLAPDKSNLVVTSQPNRIELAEGGFTDNVSFFMNVVFPTPGTYWVQTLANSSLVEEFPLIVTDAATANSPSSTSATSAARSRRSPNATSSARRPSSESKSSTWPTSSASRASST